MRVEIGQKAHIERDRNNTEIMGVLIGINPELNIP